MATTGKIFPESANVYQDQAKILFDYYRQAAEKIVREEERIEQEVSKLKREKAALAGQPSKWWLLVFIFMYFVKKKQVEEQIASIDSRIAEFEKQYKAIFRDYKVSKLGVAYVPVADQIKYEDKSFIVDYTGKVDEVEVALQMSRQNDLLIETINKLDTLSAEAPIVESSDEVETIDTGDYSTSLQELNQHNYIGNLERSLRTISFCMDDLETSSVSLPLVAEKSDYLGYLGEYATKEVSGDAPVIEVFDKGRYSASVDKFQALNRLKDSLSTETLQFESVLKRLMLNMANSVQSIMSLKVASVDKVVFESNKVLFNILKSPYNHYSPVLEYEEIERIKNENFNYSEDVQGYEPFHLNPSSRMKFNLITGTWTSEDGNVSNVPFGVHQIYEEIVAPVVQNLMEETRIERLKIYNHIKDQKISYLNKWHQDTDAFYRANRAESADLINLMQESLREYVAAYNTLVSLKKTEESMMASNKQLDSTVVNAVSNAEETLMAFELQSQEFQKCQTEFEEYIDRIKEDIDRKAERFGHVEYYDARLRDGYSNEVAVATDEVHSLDARRKSLASVNPLYAKTSDIPPQPSVEEIAFEHISLNLPAIAKNALDELGGYNGGLEMPVAPKKFKEDVQARPEPAPMYKDSYAEVEDVEEEEPVMEEPVVEEPVIEQPVMEETPVEEPFVEDVPLEDEADEDYEEEEYEEEEADEDEDEVVEEEEAFEEPVVEEPIVEEPVAEEPVEEEVAPKKMKVWHI